MKVLPAATSVTMAAAASRARSASAIALHTLNGRASQCTHGSAPLRGSSTIGRDCKVIIDAFALYNRIATWFVRAERAQ